MNQQLRILAAAAQLQRFTSYDLAAATGITSNTVRSVLRRNADFFTVETAADSGRSRGRPTNRYTVANADGLRSQLADVRDSLDWVAMPRVDSTNIDRQTARLDVAENSLRRAWVTDRPDDGRKLASVAAETADVLLKQTALPDDLRPRALRVKAVGEMLGIPDLAPGQQQRALHGVATSIAALVERSSLTALVLLRALLQLTRQLHQAPPVGVIAHANLMPENLLRPDADTRWSKRSLKKTGDWLWSPTWSAPLAEYSALAGVVLRVDEDTAHFDVAASLSELREWTPKIVMGDSDPYLIEEATKEGAMFLPSSIEDISESAVTGIGTALDQRISGFKTDEDPVIAELMTCSLQGASMYGSLIVGSLASSCFMAKSEAPTPVTKKLAAPHSRIRAR